MRATAWSWPILLASAILAGCWPAPVPAGYDFITHSLPPGSAMAARLEGTLAVTGGDVADTTCLVVVQGSMNVTYVAWPDKFVLALSDDRKVEIHGDGQVFRQGDEVQLGGGEITEGVHHSIAGACQAAAYFAAQTFP